MDATKSVAARPAASPDGAHYYLRTYPQPGTPATEASYLYLRLHGSGTSSVMLTPSSPIHLRAHFEPTQASEPTDEDGSELAPKAGPIGKQIFTSGTPRHAGRSWGLVLTTDPRDTKAISSWERAEIQEGSSEDGWTFDSVEVEAAPGSASNAPGGHDTSKVVVEQLVWKGGPVKLVGDHTSDSQESEVYQWRGWMVCSSQFGHPQLFWITDKLEGRDLPAYCERVIVVREWL